MAEPQDMMRAVTASMRERTGRTLDEWVAQVTADGLDPLDQKAVRAHLKERYGIAQNSQWAIADAAARGAGWVPPGVGESTDALYSGKKAALRPLHDAVVTMALALDGVEAQARGTYVPLVRRTQLAAVALGPRGTLRVGLRFREGAPAVDLPGGVELAEAKGFAQATHWVHVPGDTDPTSLGWLEPLLHAAWAQNG